MSRRLHHWMYGLIYPAVLGAMLVQSLIDPVVASKIPFWPWAPLILVYFLMSYGEGAMRIDDYDGRGFALDLVEVAALLAAFVAIGRFDPAWPAVDPGVELLGGSLAVAFTAAVIHHITAREGQARPEWARVWLFWIAMAAIAAAISVAFGYQVVGYPAIVVLMIVYVGVAVQPGARPGAA